LEVQDLRPASATEGGLVFALQAYAERFSASTGIHAEVDFLGEATSVDTLPDPVIDCLYRAAQDCLSSVQKRADSSLVYVELDVRSATAARMSVMDDGDGPFSKGEPDHSGVELRGLADRVSALHGTMEITRGHDQSTVHGTTVVIVLPALRTKVL
jgi:signal transduction histidine kinase